MSKSIAAIKKALLRYGFPSMNVLRVASAVIEGETVTIGSRVYEVDTNSSITAGRLALDLSASAALAAAAQTLTSDNTNAANNDTVTIGAKVYTFKTALTPTEGEVLIGADADASLLNLIRAINHSGTPGTHYSCAVANTQVTAAVAVTSHAFAVTAILKGTGGNAIASTETSAHLSWGAALLAGGVDPTAAEFTTSLTAAINADTANLFFAERISANEVLIYSRVSSVLTTACTETLTGSNNAWASATAYAGRGLPFNDFPNNVPQVRVPLTQEVTLGLMNFRYSFPPTGAVVQVRTTSTGAVVAYDGKLTISGNRITLDNSGSVDWATTSTVTVVAFS